MTMDFRTLQREDSFSDKNEFQSAENVANISNTEEKVRGKGINPDGGAHRDTCRRRESVTRSRKLSHSSINDSGTSQRTNHRRQSRQENTTRKSCASSTNQSHARPVHLARQATLPGKDIFSEEKPIMAQSMIPSPPTQALPEDKGNRFHKQRQARFIKKKIARWASEMNSKWVVQRNQDATFRSQVCEKSSKGKKAGDPVRGAGRFSLQLEQRSDMLPPDSESADLPTIDVISPTPVSWRVAIERYGQVEGKSSPGWDWGLASPCLSDSRSPTLRSPCGSSRSSHTTSSDASSKSVALTYSTPKERGNLLPPINFSNPPYKSGSDSCSSDTGVRPSNPKRKTSRIADQDGHMKDAYRRASKEDQALPHYIGEGDSPPPAADHVPTKYEDSLEFKILSAVRANKTSQLRKPRGKENDNHSAAMPNLDFLDSMKVAPGNEERNRTEQSDIRNETKYEYAEDHFTEDVSGQDNRSKILSLGRRKSHRNKTRRSSVQKETSDNEDNKMSKLIRHGSRRLTQEKKKQGQTGSPPIEFFSDLNIGGSGSNSTAGTGTGSNSTTGTGSSVVSVEVNVSDLDYISDKPKRRTSFTRKTSRPHQRPKVASSDPSRRISVDSLVVDMGKVSEQRRMGRCEANEVSFRKLRAWRFLRNSESHRPDKQKYLVMGEESDSEN